MVYNLVKIVKIIHDFAKELLGKRIGSIIEYNYHRYIIVDIR